MDLQKNKKKLALFGALLLLTTYHAVDYEYHPKYEIIDEYDGAYAKYSLGKMYIGDFQFLSSLSNLSENDILVLDQRGRKDPNMKVFNSRLIFDKNIRNEVLEVLCEYERCHPSDWDRSIESMRVEWLMHNLSYFFNYERNRTADVDLNNADEKYYDNIIYRKILKL